MILLFVAGNYRQHAAGHRWWQITQRSELAETLENPVKKAYSEKILKSDLCIFDTQPTI